MKHDYIELSGYFIAGVALGLIIHILCERAQIPVLARLFIAMLAAEEMYKTPDSGNMLTHTYFRIGVFYTQAPLPFLENNVW